MPNRLAGETSPYLLQHASNPVDWYPWGDEAFDRARAENKPVIVSIGYSACHWCHVMERECFEHPEIAAIQNEHFVSIKVDREERPDVDALYMDAVQQMTGHGGWPLNAFATPDGAPFHAGTYFPPQPRHGMPSWPQLLLALAREWREKGERIADGAARNASALRGAAALQPSGAELSAEPLDVAVETLRATYDSRWGGWGGAPKFPAASVIDFLLRRGEDEMSVATLHAMASGAMYDQIGGGFARYSTDERWEIPHFEKMLYDNALLARAYLHGWQEHREPVFEQVCRETLDWALRELRQEEGGFASALDADSDGVEGQFYVWTLDEVRSVLADDADVAIEALGMTERGNFEGRNAPVRGRAPLPAEIRQRLYDARAQRVWPGLDDKRLCSWNGLMISALAEAGVVLDEPRYVDAAADCAEFVLRDLRARDGSLLRVFNRGQAKIPAFLEDHAFLLDGLLELYQATFDARWYSEAMALAETVLERFGDPELGGFFSTAGDDPRLARRKELEDAPVPSGGAAAALALLRLSMLSGEARYEDAAVGWLRLVSSFLAKHPLAFGHALQGLDLLVGGPRLQVALVGPADDVRDLARVVRERWRPRLVTASGDGPVPLLHGRQPVDGRAAAYVCERFACRRPVTDPDELRASLTD